MPDGPVKANHAAACERGAAMGITQQVTGAQRHRPALARCIRIDPDEFATEYWGRRPLLSRSGEPGAGSPDRDSPPDRYDDLITLDDVDELISRRGLRTPFVRMARDGKVLDPKRYTGPGGAGAQIADQALDERVLACFADGATLVLQGLHRLWPPLGDFARQLASDLGHPVGVNAYLTPANSQGFATHYDTHDVFALQVAGTKRWRIYPPVIPHPLPSQPWDTRTEEVSATAQGEPLLDVVLRPGDALYLPRGWLHAAQARDELSMHLTVGIFQVSRYDLAQALLSLVTERLADQPQLRQSLPLGAQSGDPQQIAGDVTTAIQGIRQALNQIDADAVAARMRQRIWPRTRPEPLRPLAQATALRSVSGHTRVAPRGHLLWHLVERDDTVRLQVFDRTITFPARCAAALRYVLTAPVTQVGELPGLDPEDQVALAARLLREAIVIPVDP
mgnify:CR=1 FL=1